MGIEPRRLPGWVLAVAIGAVVVIAAGGLVAVLSLVDDRAMVPSSTAHTASPVPAIDRTSEIPGNAESWMAGTRSLPGMAAPVSSADRMPEELPRRDPAPQPDPAFQPQPAALAPLTPASNTAPTNDVERTQLNPSMLIARGDEFLANSDVSAARLFYRRAFDGGSAAGAAAMGATYDPLVLEQRGLRGVHPDPAAALQWYRTAAQQGSGAADARGLALIERLRSRAAAGDGEARAALERALP